MATQPDLQLRVLGAGVAGSPANNDSVWEEDVLDMITDVSPWETPVVTMMPKTQARHTTHEWLIDNLSASNPLHGIRQGWDIDPNGTSDLPNAQFEQRSRIANWVQTFRRDVFVANIARIVNPFGISDEYAYQVGKKVKEMGRDLEKRIFQDTFVYTAAFNTTLVGTAEDAGVPARMKPLMQLLNQPFASGVGAYRWRANDLVQLSAEAGDDCNFTTHALPWTQKNITEEMINFVMEQMYGVADTGGTMADTMIVPPATYRHIGLFGAGGIAVMGGAANAYGSLTVNMDAGSKKIIRAIKFYESQFGILTIINSRWVEQAKNTGTGASLPGVGAGTIAAHDQAGNAPGFAWFLERNRFRLAFLRPFRHVPLPPTGDNTRGMVIGDATLELLHPKAAAVLVGVNNVLT